MATLIKLGGTLLFKQTSINFIGYFDCSLNLDSQVFCQPASFQGARSPATQKGIINMTFVEGHMLLNIRKNMQLQNVRRTMLSHVAISLQDLKVVKTLSK